MHVEIQLSLQIEGKLIMSNLFMIRRKLFMKWLEFLATDPEVPGSISGPSRFSDKQRVWNGVHSAS
jgi:hypothetical protein